MVLRPQRQRRATAVAAAAVEEKEAVAASFAPVAPAMVMTGQPSFKLSTTSATAISHMRSVSGTAGKLNSNSGMKARIVTLAPGSGCAGRSKTSGGGYGGFQEGGAVPATATTTTSVASTSSSKKSQTPEFLVKLHRILLNEDKDIIYWDNGQIHVRDPTVLGQSVLHKYFRHSKYSSFQRQLNYFGFRKTQGKGKMSACTYTNVQLSGGNIKSLLSVKRKSSTVVGKEGGEGEEDSPLVGEEAEEVTDSDDEATDSLSPGSVGLKRGASLSFSSISTSGGHQQGRKRMCSVTSGDCVSLQETLAADDFPEDREDGSEANTSAGALSGYASSMSDGQDGGDEKEGDGEAEGAGGISFAPTGGSASDPQQRHALDLSRSQGRPRLSLTIPGGVRQGQLAPLSTAPAGPATVKSQDPNALPNFFSYNVLPAPSPRGADDLFPSCLTSFDTVGDSASSPWAWAEPPVSGSLSSLSLETGSGMTPLGTLEEGHSNQSAFNCDQEVKEREGLEREAAQMPSAAAIAAAALCSPRGENAFLLQMEGDFWGNRVASTSV
ncbi:ion channel [Nannochloropsis gaditana CCMP526]|nr:ion channel [Nannochloropsis gaditana CCMP526]EKU21844.1 ion channel [Nannochloropsis gaditana CCMP526]|eukprot:XP_005854517.1 ion channel [Nannochloropsis gaditana CCMP526]